VRLPAFPSGPGAAAPCVPKGGTDSLRGHDAGRLYAVRSLAVSSGAGETNRAAGGVGFSRASHLRVVGMFQAKEARIGAGEAEEYSAGAMGGRIMDRKRLIEETIEYFRSNQWKDVVQLVQERDMNHIHVYVDTSLHPYDSLGPLVKGYFRKRGWEVYRDIKRLGAKPGVVALYNIDLEDKISFEIYCRLTSDVVLSPTPPGLGERGGNLRVWTDRDIRRFQEQFNWRDLSSDEETEIAEFFRSGKHWQKALDYIMDPDVVHIHCNIETSVHPSILRRHGLEDLSNRGWTVKHAIHSIFNGGGLDVGKIIFLGLKPEKTYDIAYYYNPDVLIETNTQETRMHGDEGTGNEFFVLRVSAAEKELAKHKFHTLSGEEIQEILQITATFDTRSAYSWRFIAA